MINFWFYGHCTYIITILVIQQKYNTSDYYGIRSYNSEILVVSKDQNNKTPPIIYYQS